MPSFAVLTPSYGPDFRLCCELNRSVLEWSAPEVEHHVVVPRRDRELFAPLAGARTHVWTIDQLVPRAMLAIPWANAWVNLRRPYLPVRGWVMQQVVKLAATAELGVDVLLLVDSDITFVRPFGPETFRQGGPLRFYRAGDAVSAEMSRHVIWHDVARRLLGLPTAGPPPLPDYVGPVIAWDRDVVLALKGRIERVMGRPWLDAVASQLHFSELILYGVFVDQVLGAAADVRATRSMVCHNYWGPGPLAPEAVPEFAGSLSPTDIAVMISAKSHTPAPVRQEVLSRIRAAASSGSRNASPLAAPRSATEIGASTAGP